MPGFLKTIMGMFRRAGPEPPPEWGKALGLAPGYTVKTLPTLAEVDAYCRANHVDPNDAYNRRKIEACVIPDKHEAVFAEDRAYGDPKTAAEVKVHEFFHTQGPVHVDGKGWFIRTAQGLIPVTKPTDLMAGRLFAAREGVFAQRSTQPAGILGNQNKAGD